MTSIANERRGEVEITIDGKTYGMRPTYDALMGIDALRFEDTPGGWLQVVRRAATASLSIREAAYIALIGIKAGGTKRENLPAFEDVTKQIIRENPMDSETLAKIITYIVNANNQLREPSEETGGKEQPAGK